MSDFLACVTEPVSWLRLERYHLEELGPADRARIAAHLAACAACRACLLRIEADDTVAPPPLTLPAKGPARPTGRRPWPSSASGLVAFAALAATMLVAIVRIPGRRALGGAGGARTKGGAFAFALERDDGQRLEDLDGAFRDGDRFKAIVTCPASGAGESLWFDVVVFDREGPTFPLEPRALDCGNEVPLAGAFRLTGRSHERVCLVWNDEGPVDRRRLAHDDLTHSPFASCKTLEPEEP